MPEQTTGAMLPHRESKREYRTEITGTIMTCDVSLQAFYRYVSFVEELSATLHRRSSYSCSERAQNSLSKRARCAVCAYLMTSEVLLSRQKNAEPPPMNSEKTIGEDGGVEGAARRGEGSDTAGESPVNN